MMVSRLTCYVLALFGCTVLATNTDLQQLTQILEKEAIVVENIHTKNENTQTIKPDSVFQLIQDNLEKHQKTAAPEKLYLHTDRSLFEPGETIWFAAYIRNAADLAASDKSQIMTVELKNPRGETLKSKQILAKDGVCAGEFRLQNQWPGGQYKIVAFSNWMKNEKTQFEKKITVQKVIIPRLNMKLEFEKKAYGPGDQVRATLDFKTLTNEVLADTEMNFTATNAGKTIFSGKATSDENGTAILDFKLPKTIDNPNGLLNITLKHEGQMEYIARAIPIVLEKIDLQFFFEGGDCIENFPVKMAFKGLNAHGKPADLAGKILDEENNIVCEFESFHQGMGAFEFTPKAGKSYAAQLDKPFKTEAIFELPKAKKEGINLHILEKTDAGIKLQVRSANPQKVYITATKGDKIVHKQLLPVGKSAFVCTVPTADLGIGVLRITAFTKSTDDVISPIAERLTFINPNKALKINVETNQAQYLPLEEVKMKISIKDHLNKPVEGNFSLAVCDEAQLSFADDKQGHILAALLLEQDVKGAIDEPNFYFDPKEEKATAALDHLLLTQGWRRFEWTTVLQTAPTKPVFEGQKTNIGGQLVSSYTGQALRWKKLRLEPNGPSMKTDKDGRFLFENVDIDKYYYISGKDVNNLSINAYGENYTVYCNVNDGAYWVKRKTQTGETAISGKIVDNDSGEALIGATIMVKNTYNGTSADLDGHFKLALEAGTYDIVVSYTGFTPVTYKDVKIKHGESIQVSDTKMNTSMLLCEIGAPTLEYAVPLITEDQTTGGQTLTSDQIRNLPTRSVNAIKATAVGAKSMNLNEIVVRGSRSNAANYYVDGIRVSANAVGIADLDEDIYELDEEAGFEEFDLEKRALEEANFEVMDEVTELRKERNKDKKRRQNRFASKQKIYTTARTFYSPKYGGKQAKKVYDNRTTLYWNPSVKTNKKGEANLSFYTSNKITNFRATLEGLSTTGQIGRSESHFFSQKPLSLNVKTPPFVVSGDVLKLDLIFTNKTDYELQTQWTATVPAHFTLQNQQDETVTIPAQGETVLRLEYAVGQSKNDHKMPLQFGIRVPDAYEDNFTASIRTLAKGFPIKATYAGTSLQNRFAVQLNDAVAQTVDVKLNVYPDALIEILTGLKRMIRQPSGCFEQVSSSNYPNILALNILRKTNNADQALEKQTLTYLQDGYKKLAAYECQKGGFDWWGNGDGHEGLTAYGIIQFHDMAQVFDGVDDQMTKRSVKWLLSRRDGKGNWMQRSDQHGWNSKDVLNAYITWALTEAGHGNEIKRELNQAYKAAVAADDAYQLALLANSFLVLNDKRGKVILQKLIRSQGENGAWKGKTHSIMSAYGLSFEIETTALITLAMQKSGDFPSSLHKAMDYIKGSKTAYGYGSTQSTVVALKAIANYVRTPSKATNAKLIVQINGEKVEEMPLSSNHSKLIEPLDLSQYFAGKKSENVDVDVYFEGLDQAMPFDMEVNYASRRPSAETNDKFSFTTNFSTKKSTKIGDLVEVELQLTNKTDGVLASPMVVLGIPAGLSIEPWQLKKLQEEKAVNFYEIWDGKAVFHYDKLNPNEEKTLRLALRANIAGNFEAPASRAFLYYDNEERVWTKPGNVVIR